MFRNARGGLAALALVAALFLAPSADAARGWHPPSLIGTGDSQPKVAVNAGGVAAAVWLADGSVQASVRTAGTWSAPQALGPSAYVLPDVAVDGSGTVFVVWERLDYVVEAAVKPAGGAWLPSQAISAAGIAWPLGARVAVDGGGNATAIWYRTLGSGDLRIETAVRPASTGVWQTPVEIGRGVNPDLAVQPGGSAVAVWSAWPGDYAVQAAVRSSDGTWQAPATLSGTAYIFLVKPRVAVDGAGNAIALWSRMRGDSMMALESASRPFGSSGWQPPETLVTGRVYGYIPGISDAGLAVNPAGNAVISWEQWDGNAWVRAAYRTAGAAWQAPQDLSQRSDNLDPVVAQDLAGNALVLWSRSTVEVSFRDVATGIWTAAMSISGNGGRYPAIAFDGSGDAVAVWSRYVDGGPQLVEAAVYAEGGVPPAPKCRVPKVIGLRLAAARSALNRAKCRAGRVRRARSRRVRRGRVVAQSRRPRVVLNYRARINLVVSRGRR